MKFACLNVCEVLECHTWQNWAITITGIVDPHFDTLHTPHSFHSCMKILWIITMILLILFWPDQNYWIVNMPPTNEITSETIISSDKFLHLLVDPDMLDLIARNFASHCTSTATLRHYHFLFLSIDRLKLDLEHHHLEQQAIFTYLMKSRTFWTELRSNLL